ncbi:MAG TPA: DUF1152 domain-containing protein [Solirubrobacteraceae bacterium]|nr:DUF1152 domain-containing protein [Solirubrobacteraceae bacterium]
MGIGGGGDVVGALAAAELLGGEAVVGGLTWERRPVDPIPGPRLLAEVVGAEPLNAAVALCGPDTSGPGGFLFCESHVARATGSKTVLVDPNPGPRAVAAALDDAAQRLGCDRIVLLDVGGDVLAHGDEPGLASPLADAVLLACAAFLRTPCLGAVFGAGCDAELKPDEVRARLDEVGTTGEETLSAEQLDRLEKVVVEVPTEASAMALRCARGERGEVPIRQGRRNVLLTELGGIVAWFDPSRAMDTAARLAAIVRDARSLEEADALLEARGIRTELAYERDMAASEG